MPSQPPLSELTDRSREVFRVLVETYLSTGAPVGSRTLSRAITEQVSAATVRNVMQDLEELGLLDSPHTSAGRQPTELGLRLFVDGILEVSRLSGDDRTEIEKSITETDANLAQTLDQAGAVLSGLTQGASLVLAPKQDSAIKHLEFVSLSPDQALVVMVLSDGTVENRLFTPPLGMTPSAMREAANFLNAVLEGQSIKDMRHIIAKEIERRRQEIDTLSRTLIEAGIAEWDRAISGRERLIVRGQANLIDDTNEDLDRIRQLFTDLERKEGLTQLLDLTEAGQGVRVFIGSENKLFSLSGSSLVVSPYMNADRQIIGAVGVIGPTRLNYGRVVPIVDFTAQLVGRMISDR